MIEIYQKYLELKKVSKDEWKGKCPFHDDDTPSFYVNEITTLYYCFGCGASGNLRKFLKLSGIETENIPETQDIKEEDYQITFAEAISPTVIEQFHHNLLNDFSKLQYIIKERLISYFIIKKHLLGYDTRSQRFAIPIKGRSGKFANIKLHNSNSIPKSLYFQSGKARLFPFGTLSKSQIVITEGEFDCLALQSVGISAITSTSGARGWNESWNIHFIGKEIKILYDNDDAGINGAEIVSKNLSPITNSCEIFHLKDAKDTTEFLKQKGDIFRLLKIRKIK